MCTQTFITRRTDGYTRSFILQLTFVILIEIEIGFNFDRNLRVFIIPGNVLGTGHSYREGLRVTLIRTVRTLVSI